MEKEIQVNLSMVEFLKVRKLIYWKFFLKIIHLKTFYADESFSVQHNKRGILGMSNQGRNTNGSQFYVTFQAIPFMDKKYVAFGRVVEGSETLQKLEEINTQNQRPTKELKIEDCGQYIFEF